MVVIGLLTFIVGALMTVFSSTQTAFRASVTQSDVLEGGRATIDLIAQDIKQMTASGGTSNRPVVLTIGFPYNTFSQFFTNRDYVNFYVAANNQYTLPLIQPLIGSADGARRTNALQNFFILSRDNVNGHDTWIGTGYAVDSTNLDSPLYRFTMQVNANSGPGALFNTYMAGVLTNGFKGPGWSHLIDGVLDLRVRAYDPYGYWITNLYAYDGGGVYSATNQNTYFPVAPVYAPPPPQGEVGLYMFSNTVPASVEVQLGVLEDRIRRRAESIPVFNARSNYLSQQAGAIHLFRQRVTISNSDRVAYQ